MIVRSVESGWEVIFQRSHGLLAGQLAEYLRAEFKPPLWIETLEATLSHDDLKEAFDARHYVTDLGAPKDFALVDFSSQKRADEAKRRVTEATRKHQWVGLLQSLHVEQLYAKADDLHPDLTAFVKSERERRKRVIDDHQWSEATVREGYGVLRWADRCSLLLCRDNLPAMGRQIEINDGLGRSTFARQDGESVTVQPWPFDRDAFEVGVEVRTLSQLEFGDDRELIHQLDAAKPAWRTWRFEQRDDRADETS